MVLLRMTSWLLNWNDVQLHTGSKNNFLSHSFFNSASQNYGDESDAYGLINPSIYSNHGVYEKDFFQPRDQYEVMIT